MQFEWIDFYSEFATKLLDYKDSRDELIDKIKAIYTMTGIPMPTLEMDNNLVDIDPFTIFGLFNKKLQDVKRIKILTAIAELFDIKTVVPKSFDGLPVLDPRNATFYCFIGERDEDDINDLWELFSAALSYANKPTDDNKKVISHYFDLTISKKGIGNSKITMALFWISPDSFLNLDSRNEWYIYESGKVPADVVSGLPEIKTKLSAFNYFKIVEALRNYLQSSKCELKDFMELSYYAWVISEQVNQEEKAATTENKTSNATLLRWFRPLIQALRDLGGLATPADARKKIIENEQLTDDEVNEIRGKNNVNKFENEVAFARNYLVSGGYIDKSVYGVWALTEAGKTVDMTDELASDIFKKGVYENRNKRTSGSSALADDDVDTVHYWIYSPGENSSMWEEFYNAGIMAIGWGEIGNLKAFESKDAMKAKMKEVIDPNLSYKNAAHATWQFANEMKIGDVVFVKKGMHQLVGRGVVASDYEYDEERTDKYANYRKVNWTHKGEWTHPGQAAMKTLTDITSYTESVEKLNALFENDSEDDVEETTKDYPVYTAEDFLDEVFMPEDEYSRLVGILKTKKNIILQGAPGVGKTFAAKRLAYSVMGVKDIERVMMVQFHQSYSYEDFIMGFRPSAEGFELKKGAFYNFCKKAEIDSDNDYFFIIDEINRGNLSKIFGELFMLIENDKRGISLQLLYSDEKFAVPKNVYIIGMMNTADRSLAMLDYALRRRFAFFELKPGFETDGFREYRMAIDDERFNKLINCVENLNNVISADESLGDGFCIGHSYFCNLSADSIDEQTLYGIVEYELIPLLREYWFDEPLKVKDWSNNLRSAIK